MDIRQLRYFVTVAQEGNFTRAAERLHIAQPPLSRQIQQIEERVGATLIDRSAKPLRLTPIGHLVYDQAISILARMADMDAMIAKAVVSQKRRFAIGFVASTIYSRLPAIIRAYREAMPSVDLSLIEGGTLSQIAALKEGRIDVGFGRIRFEDDAVARVVLREEPLIVALPASHPLAAGGPVSLTALATDPLILYPNAPRPSYADQVVGHFHDLGVTPLIAHEVSELQIAIGLVAAGEGFCIVPASVRRSRVDGVRYRQLVERVASPIIMSFRKDDRSPELHAMAAVIRERYGAWDYPVPDAILRMTDQGEAG
ncbi:LysR family transcriptional regulator [Sphingomonas sp. GM_Shp_1]|uniref:LysR family transcriptional regulator n=1 Tax=Sphingomonas sp. GM_Shp_1 TaxID=2937381 RepID=UPI00226B8220|nr:LysR family transcriptional regulator [Sphingomonas sp. GM_Shp_1]